MDQGTFPPRTTIPDSSHTSVVSYYAAFTPFANHDQNSYPVSPDVGKVGNESSTFIEPISERKDGIVAMFASQGSRKSKISSPIKRKRSVSPPVKRAKRTIAKEESVEFLGFGKTKVPWLDF